LFPQLFESTNYYFCAEIRVTSISSEMTNVDENNNMCYEVSFQFHLTHTKFWKIARTQGRNDILKFFHCFMQLQQFIL